ncbi:phospholipase SGR2 [Canna indica]|uniref:Phospholipase SGR2 n=1 Tax=Canna indica TaxID=4628 RepID=A0AAQ3KAH1_9LILI|nr:phospholipase SGR2 [Canna indica]
MEDPEVNPFQGQSNEAVPFFSDASGFNQVEGSLPDLLKNTPSNIARLEDAVEQCKGHQKYIAHTKSPSDGEDVRWYFCKVPLAEKELAASVPRTEIVGKSDYFRFSVRDSLALEASFLQREEELLAHWWKEYAECSEGPSGPQMTDSSTSGYGNDELYVVEEERVGVPVKGGLYEVDLTKRHCFPVYWSGENRRVLRGHWFARKGGLDWFPLREDIAEQLELAYRFRVWHRRTFQPSGQFAARIDLQGTTRGLHALFTGEDDTWEAWLAFDSTGFSLGSGNSVKLRRGFSTSGSLNPTQDELRQQKEEEMDDYCSQVPVGHLVFMVHGIGQRLEKANLVDDVGDFRRITASLAERHLTPYQRSTQRVLFIPCQWRKGLKLSSESAVEKITLDGVRGLRVTLSATVHDVLYYMSPIYCQDIIDSVSNQLNRLYSKFLKRNPGYDGKVSLYGHSLGSVLSYDILCHQECSSASFPMETLLMKNNDIPEKESDVDASYQPIQSSVSMRPENHDTKIGTVSESLTCVGGSSTSHKYSSVYERETGKLSCTEDHNLNKDLQEVLSDNGGSVDTEEEFDDVDRLYFNEKHVDTFLLKQADEKVKDPSAQSFCDEGKSSTANLNRIVDSEDAAAKDARFHAEEIVKKEKVFSLEEEVKSLKAKITELENIHCSATYFRHNIESDETYHGKGKVVESSSQTSEKISTQEDAKRKSYTPYIRYTKLNFKVDTFFAVGSPLGVFLALRNVRIGVGRGQDYWQDEKITEEMLPACRQMFNIFHPFDPVAYRVEPLICKEFIKRRPVIIPYHRGGKRLHIGFQEFTEEIAVYSQAMRNQINSFRVYMVRVFQSRNKDNNEGTANDIQQNDRSYGSIMMERLTGSQDGRVDHALQDKTFRHPYISAMKSHTNYWRDKDTALFILNHLYRDIPEESPITEPATNGHGVGQRTPTKLFYERDIMEEETPLTFCDSYSIREFSRKAKKVVNSR